MIKLKNLKPYRGECLDFTAVFLNMAYILFHKLIQLLYQYNFPSPVHSAATANSCLKGFSHQPIPLILGRDEGMIFALFGFNFRAKGILLNMSSH